MHVQNKNDMQKGKMYFSDTVDGKKASHCGESHFLSRGF